MAGEALMGWPDDTTLPVEVHAAFGADPAGDPGDWTFTDLTSRLRPVPIPIRRGASDGAGEVSPATATVELDNDDGALTPGYPMSPYWPDVELNTPIRICLRRGEDTFARTSASGWGQSESGQSWTINGTGTDFPVTGGAGQHRHGVVHTLRRTALDSSLIDTEQLIDVSTPVMLSGAALVTGVIARYDPSTFDYYWFRAEFNSGGSTVTLKISRSDGGVQTTLVELTTVPSLSYAINTPLRLRASILGNVLSAKVWTASGTEPVGWHVQVTDTDPLPGPGQVGVQSWLVIGNSNVLPVIVSHRNYRLLVDRMNGFADQWQPSFIPTSDGNVVSTIRITASGILRRLGQGTSPLNSALRRVYERADNLIAWWPLDEPTAAERATSGLPGGAPMVPSATGWNGYAPVSTPTGVVTFGVEGAGGTPALVNLSGGGFLAAPIPPSTETSWQVEIVARVDIGTYGGAPAIPISWFGGTTPTGRAYEFDIYFTDTGVVAVGGDPNSSSEFVLQSTTNPYDGVLHHYAVAANQNGANTDFFLWVDGVFVDSGTWASITLPKLNQVILNYYTNAGDPLPSVGHYAVFAPAPFTADDTAPAARAHVGESATDRIERLCGEEGVPVTVRAGNSELMGPQPMDGFLNLLRECERADMGILYEHGWGLGYRPRVSRYNQTPALSIDLATYRRTDDVRQDQVVAPTYDDQGVRNDWTVSRVNGASARVVDAEHVARFGTYDDSVELNVASDARLAHHAAWRVHLGT